jgi:mRNA interferase RelE/StbE
VSPERYRVDLAPAAQRQLRKLPPGDAATLRGPILALALDPRAAGAARLAGADLWRIRVGNLRVIYAIEADERVVVLKVARRSESTYRRVG